MKRYILLLLILMIGCSSNNSNQNQNTLEGLFPDYVDDDNEKEISEFAEEEYAFEEPTLEESGEDVIIAIGSEELEIGSVDRSIQFKKTGTDYKQTFVLEFNEAQQELIETIPKSFAASAKDLEFSLQPEIIEDDPVVKWFIDRQITKIEVTVKNQVVTAAALAGIKNAFNNPKQAALNAGGDEAILSFIESIDDFALITKMSKCEKFNDFRQQECIFQLIQKNPDKFTVEDCKGLNGFFYLQETWANSCEAILRDDIDYCMDFDMGKSSEKYEKYCRKYFYEQKNNKCKDEKCMYNICLGSIDIECCDYVKDKTMNKKCLASTTSNIIFCADITDPKEAKDCCNLFKSKKQECLEKLEPTEELEVIPEEVESDKEFRARSSHCPYPVPDDAVWVEKGYNDLWAEGFQVDGKWVGVVTKVHSRKTNITQSITCYKNGVLHGLKQEFSKTGTKTVIISYEDGKVHGDWLQYHANGELASKSTFDHDVRVGEIRSYYDDGSIHTEGQYKNGDLFGHWNFYKRDGSLSMEQEYDENGKQTLYKTYK